MYKLAHVFLAYTFNIEFLLFLSITNTAFDRLYAVFSI